MKSLGCCVSEGQSSLEEMQALMPCCSPVSEMRQPSGGLEWEEDWSKVEEREKRGIKRSGAGGGEDRKGHHGNGHLHGTSPTLRPTMPKKSHNGPLEKGLPACEKLLLMCFCVQFRVLVLTY